MSSLRTVLSLIALAAAPVAKPAASAAPSGDLADGKGVFEANCQICHGAAGKGDGPGAAALNPKPADFTSAAFDKIPDETRIRAVTGGGASVGKSPQMPPFKDVLTPAQIRDVIAFIRKSLHS